MSNCLPASYPYVRGPLALCNANLPKDGVFIKIGNLAAMVLVQGGTEFHILSQSVFNC